MMRTLLSFLIFAAWAHAAAPTLQLSTYRLVTAVQTLIEAGRFDEARVKLDEHACDPEDHPFDAAYLRTVEGHLHIARGQYAEAVDALSLAYDSHALDEHTQLNTLYNIAQLELALGRYEACVHRYEAWSAQRETIDSDAWTLYAEALTQLKRYPEARRAIDAAIRAAAQPVENHYRLRFYLDVELGDTASALETMKQIIARFEPDAQDWTQLAGLYLRDERYAQALAAMQAGYAQGVLETPEALTQLAQLCLYEAIPYRAAQVIEAGLADETLLPTAETLELLGNAYYQARETRLAIDAYARAARLSPDARLDLRLARLYVDARQYERVLETTKNALDKPVRKAGELYFLRGIALYELERPLEAQRAFGQAAQTRAWANRARQWIAYLTEKQ